MEENKEIKNIISSYFFSLVNAILIIYSQLFIKSNDNQERYLKFKIILIIAIDSFSIIFQLIYQSTLNEIFYEIINTFLSRLFYGYGIILSMFNLHFFLYYEYFWMDLKQAAQKQKRVLRLPGQDVVDQYHSRQKIQKERQAGKQHRLFSPFSCLPAVSRL